MVVASSSLGGATMPLMISPIVNNPNFGWGWGFGFLQSLLVICRNTSLQSNKTRARINGLKS
ncbi:MAG: hypothetical protein Ct9H90mP13_07140 [Pseudomonadota bacterium]|nr:MAG: hypothetical protein Ct9H90mP13_07140 [Pseudomonadota bacterium]